MRQRPKGCHCILAVRSVGPSWSVVRRSDVCPEVEEALFLRLLPSPSLPLFPFRSSMASRLLSRGVRPPVGGSERDSVRRVANTTIVSCGWREGAPPRLLLLPTAWLLISFARRAAGSICDLYHRDTRRRGGHVEEKDLTRIHISASSLVSVWSGQKCKMNLT